MRQSLTYQKPDEVIFSQLKRKIEQGEITIGHLKWFMLLPKIELDFLTKWWGSYVK